MASNGFGFFYNKLGLSIDDLAFYYNFSNSGPSVPVVSGNSSLSGVLDTNPNFWAQSGSGFCSGAGFEVANFSGLRDDDWSFIILPQKLGVRTEALFSTLDSGLNSGICVSFNSVNNLVVTAKDSNGYLFSTTFDLPLSDKNILGFIKAGQSITALSYDPSNFTYNSSTSLFPQSCLLNNFSKLEIGKSSSNLSSKFSGYIDEAAWVSTVLNAKQFEILCSGFLRSGYPTVTTVQSGFEFGTAHCEGGVYISGLNSSTVSTTAEVPTEVDFNFLKTLRKSGVKYVGCEDISYFSTVGFVDNPPINSNAGIFFDLINGYFRSSSSWNFGDTLFYYNGKLMNKVSDYTYSSNLLIKPSSDYRDTGVLDSIPHSYNLTTITSGAMNSGSSFAAANSNSIIFLNGDYLISGVDYVKSGSNYVSISNTFASQAGTLTEIVFSGSLVINNSTSKFIETQFYDNCLLTFVNRRRLPISSFFQLSSVESSFSPSGLPCFSGDLIYGNEGTYINE